LTISLQFQIKSSHHAWWSHQFQHSCRCFVERLFVYECLEHSTHQEVEFCCFEQCWRNVLINQTQLSVDQWTIPCFKLKFQDLVLDSLIQHFKVFLLQSINESFKSRVFVPQVFWLQAQVQSKLFKLILEDLQFRNLRC